MKTLFLSIFTSITFAVFSQNHSLHSIQKAESLLNEYTIKNTPGIAVSVIKDGKVIFRRNKGYANLEHMIAITDSTKFVVGSIAKQFTAFGILLLEDEGKLSIDDTVTKYLPELKGLSHKITIRQFLNHTSGFRDNTDLNSLKGRTDLDRTSQSEMVQLLLRQKGLNFLPGTRFQYNNSGYVLLAEIIARVAKMTFAEFMQKRIFKPLQMRHSLFLDDPSLVVKNKALSYVRRQEDFYCIPLNRSIVGSTGLYTTLGDLCLWANNFDSMTIGNKSIFKKMQTKSRLNNGESIPYALGQELKVYKGLDVVFHGGGDAGYRSYLLRVPKHKLNVVVSGNFEVFNPLNIAYGLVDVFLSDYIKEPVQKARPVYTNKDLKKFEGDYQVFPGLYITIFAEDNDLYIKGYGTNDRLKIPVLKANEFAFPIRAHSKLVFMKNRLNWHLSDFYYPAQKVTLHPPKYTDIDLQELQGVYKSDEVETSYKFIIKNGKLIATHNFNRDEVLTPIVKDSFITNASFIGRVEFTRNSSGKINGCKISGQKSHDVLFFKSN